MQYGQSILVFDGEKWITVLFVKQDSEFVWYRPMNGYGTTKKRRISDVRDIYEGKGVEPLKRLKGVKKWEF